MKPKRRVVLQWIGHSDLRALAASLPDAQRDEIMSKIKGEPAKAGDLGPIKTLVTTQRFDEIQLLCNYPPAWGKKFATWLGSRAEVIPTDLKKPTDYAAIFQIADAALSAIRQRKDWPNTELCLHLSPGTPAMAAVWLLLGKTRYPALFYETFNGQSWLTQVPFDLIDVIPEVLRNADAHLQHLSAQSPAEIQGFERIIGDSQPIRDAVGRAKRAAIRNVPVLLLGESGSGKEMFAQAIHAASPRRDKVLKSINCAALSQTLLESELFGHCKGAFTGATAERKGAFEFADGGTLFLDEIGECTLETQAKLLRVLQPIPGEGASIRHVCRLGEQKDRHVDVRIVAATNKDLHQAIQAGQFREDLFYRLATAVIHVPPLRDRKSDIVKLAHHLLDQLNQQFAADEPGYRHKSLSASANAFVKSHAWPGNVRQLHNTLMQAAIFTDGDTIGRPELAASLGEMPVSSTSAAQLFDRPLGDNFNIEEHLNTIHAMYLRKAMEQSRGVKTRAAKLLGIKNYQTLDAQLKRLKIDDNWTEPND